MEAQEFVDIVTDHSEWLKKSKDLRDNADVLWQSFADELMKWADIPEGNEQEKADLINKAIAHLNTSKMLYGLALETAFKAYIIEEYPDEIDLQMFADGNGTVHEVTVKQIGVSTNKGHDLIKLANKADAFERGENSIFDEEKDFEAFHKIITHLNEMVLWQARYPVPLKSNYDNPEDLPYKLIGHEIITWINPALDYYHS